MRVFTCISNNVKYGIPIEFIENVLDEYKVIKFKIRSHFIIGVGVWKDFVYPVMDINSFLNGTTKEEKKKLIVLKCRGEYLGICIDQLLEEKELFVFTNRKNLVEKITSKGEIISLIDIPTLFDRRK